ncbi:hypothetical protein G6F68_011843 [Rhizopus microsporus]|nr:hypothetical protein G6F68_011843 [Rhizopus microsporus]
MGCRPAVGTHRPGSTLAAQVPALFVAARLAGGRIHLLAQGVGALGGRARGDRFMPALQVRERGKIDGDLGVGADPRVAGHVGDGVFITSQEGVLGQALVHHPVQAAHLVVIALDRIRDLLRRVHIEVTHLAAHRAQTGHLPEQPFQGGDAAARVAGQELAGLLGQVQQDRTRLEHALRGTAIGWGLVDDGRHLVVGRDRKEFRLELVARADVDRVDAVLQAGFLQQQGHFVAVRGGPVIQVDHGGGSGAERNLESSA